MIIFACFLPEVTNDYDVIIKFEIMLPEHLIRHRYPKAPDLMSPQTVEKLST